MEKNYRNEFKYFVGIENLNKILQDLKIFMIKDSNMNSKKSDFYSVNSIYMDNYYMKSYRAKIAGEKNRLKIRLRNYNTTIGKGTSKLELKIRNGSKVKKINAIFEGKEAPITNDQIKKINQINDSVASRIINFLSKHEAYSYLVEILYSRIALFSKNDKSLRVTIDSDLYVKRYEKNFNQKLNFIRFLPKNISILEIKSASYIPFWLYYIIKKYSLIKTPISKYALGVQTLAASYSLDLK